MKCPEARYGGWCLKCYLGVKARQYFRGHFGWRAPPRKRKDYAMGLQRRSVVPGPGGLSPMPEACRLAAGYPDLWAFISGTTWPDTDPPEPRLTGSVTLFTEDGYVKAFLNDKAQKLSTCVSGETLSDCLAAAEEAVGGAGVAWRVARDRPQGRGRG